MVSRNRKIARRIGKAVANDVLDISGAISAGAGVTVYATADDLPTTGLTAGDEAFVSGSNRLYISNGTGWYSIGLVNTNPAITSVEDPSTNTTPFTLATDGSALVLTITAADPEGFPLTYNYSVTSGSLTNGGGTTATVGQGTGEGYAISSASILSGTYTVSAYAGGLTFKPDGTEMYYVGTNNDRVSRHTLSTPWDVSTGSYVGSSPNTLTQVSQLTDVKFNNDGTKMYMADKAGTTDNTIYQYSLSSAWDIDTATYDNKSYDFTTQLTSDELNCFVFNNDGSAVYLAELGPSRDIFQYTLSTPFDISTASYANKSLSLASVASNGYIGRQYFQFTNDGSKLFLIHTFHPAGFVGKIYEYSLTTAYDISTASHTSVTYTPAGITTGRSAIAFKPDGSRMFIMGTDNHTTISQFNLPIYSDNQFTITPTTTEAYAGTFSLTFTASDGINTATSANSFTLSFIPWGSVTQQAKIQASDAAADDFFGMTPALSSDGNTAIVGAYSEDTGGTDAGAAYIFTRSGTTWSQQAKIQASDAAAGDYFGMSVSISGDGDTAIVGAQLEGAGGGSAYIFTRSGTTWSQQDKLQASDSEANDNFGFSVSISDDGSTALVGAINEDTTGSNAGSAYIFTRSGTTWSQEAKIQASNAGSSDQFGYSVSLSNDGDTAIIGAYSEDTGGTDAGSAYIFTRSGTTWSQEAQIQASDAQANDYFGWSVSISGDGDTAIVGAYKEASGGTDAGSAYIFTRSGTTWSQQAKIQSSNLGPFDRFGHSVSLSNDGDIALIGALLEDTAATNAGAAYIFTRSGTTWSQQQKIHASDAQANDYFGRDVSISSDGSTAIVSAILEDTGGTSAGAAYIFVPA